MILNLLNKYATLRLSYCFFIDAGKKVLLIFIKIVSSVNSRQEYFNVYYVIPAFPLYVLNVPFFLSMVSPDMTVK